jgi:hypothetical protein
MWILFKNFLFSYLHSIEGYNHTISHYCLALLSPSQRNWFSKSQQTSMVAISLKKPYDKMNVGKSCSCMMFIDMADVNGIKITGYIFRIRMQNNNWIVIE